MGRHARTGLLSCTSRSRRDARRPHRQFGRRHGLYLALGTRRTDYHGRAQLLYYHLSPQPEENELPADSEQYPPGIIGAGLDMADFIIARAPSPALLLGQRYDFFDRRGLQQAYDDVAQFYDLIGAPAANRELFIGPQGHGFSRHNQEAMVEFFARHAATGSPPRVRKITTFNSAALDTTPEGNTVAAGVSRFTNGLPNAPTSFHARAVPCRQRA